MRARRVLCSSVLVGVAAAAASGQPVVDLDATDLALTNGQTVTAWGSIGAVNTPTYLENQTPTGLPAVLFDVAVGSDHMAENRLIPESAAGDFIIAAVIKPDNIGAYHNVFEMDTGAPMLWVDPGFGYEMNGGGGTIAAGTGTGGWDVIIMDSRLNQIYVNSPISNATGGGAVAYTAARAFDFFSRDGGQTFQGRVAELRVYNDAAAFGNDFAGLYFELKHKWIGFDSTDTDGDGLSDSQEIQTAQFVDTVVVASSQLSSTYQPSNVIGAPTNSFWLPSSIDGTAEFIEVAFAYPVYANGVSIRNPFCTPCGFGAVYQIDAVDAGGTARTVWFGDDSGGGIDFFQSFPTTDYLVHGLIVYIDTSTNAAEYEGIDAITLHGGTGTDPFNPDSDGDGLSDFTEIRFTHTDPNNADSDGDGLDDLIEANIFGMDPNNADTDGDGISDSQDDSDGDGILDWQELGLTFTDPNNADSDGDGVSDFFEDWDGDGLPDFIEFMVTGTNAFDLTNGTADYDADSDGDGLSDGQELMIFGSDHLNVDTDGDGIPDGIEVNKIGTDPSNPDTDGNGITDGDEDFDGDGVNNADEIIIGTSVRSPDTDFDGISDGESDFDGDGLTNATESGIDSDLTSSDSDGNGTPDYNEDADGDGLTNGEEQDTHGTDAGNSDTDGDGLSDGEEVIVHGTDPLNADSDGDGLSDGEEINSHGTDPLNTDTDGDGLTDDVETNVTLTNPNGNNGTDDFDADTDGDGLSDGFELANGTDFRDSDTDGDSVPDGADVCPGGDDTIDLDFDGIPDDCDSEIDTLDTDGDGLIDNLEGLFGYNPNSADTDGDGTPDGDEDFDSDGLTNLEEINNTRTDPFSADTDGDGLTDGDEVYIHGTDPLNPDTDGDGFSDIAEILTTNTDPLNPDSDDDGITDFMEYNNLSTDPNNPDSDGDGINDGDEFYTLGTSPLITDTNGNGTSDYDEDTDADGISDGNELSILGTDPLNPDTDGDGVSDYNEDTDRDRISDGDEFLFYFTDPTKVDTDGDGLSDYQEIFEYSSPPAYNTDPLVADTDGDGLDDGREVLDYGTEPNNWDTDGDGLSDGAEVNITGTNPNDLNNGTVDFDADTDGDGISNGDEVNVFGSDPRNPDSDGDGTPDFEEDGDGDGLTNREEVDTYNTDPLNPDTDGDGLTDGDEVSTYSTNPLSPDTDNDGLSDSDEINIHGTDPLNPDTDDDGLTDGEELFTHGTDPFNPDTDGDGLSDGDEVHNDGTDPLNPDTDGDGLIDSLEVPSEQYATSASADSEWGAGGAFATKAIGAPDSQYWSPDSDVQGFEAILTVGYDTPVYANGVTITEQWDPGFVYQIDTVDTSGVSRTVWTGTDPTPLDTGNSAQVDFFQSFPMTQYLVDGFKVYCRDPANTFFLGVDSVKLHGAGTDPNNPDSDGDGLSDGNEILIHGTNPLNPDSDNDGLSDGDEILGIFGYLTDPLNADTDGDGLSDGDEVNVWFSDPTNINTDGDTYNDFEEAILCGTDPAVPGLPTQRVAASVVDFSSQLDTGDNSADQATFVSDGLGWTPANEDGTIEHITLDYAVALHMEFVRITKLTSVPSISRVDLIEPNGTAHTVFTGPDTATQDTDFSFPLTLYPVRRIKVFIDTNASIGNPESIDSVFIRGCQAPDLDGDGLYRAEEILVYGTDHLNPDTDGDGLSDGVEVNQTGTDPLNPDTDGNGTHDFFEDSDGDSLTNGDEVYIYGTDPGNADTDGDGFTDGDEVNTFGTDPTSPDADADGNGFPDSAEPTGFVNHSFETGDFSGWVTQDVTAPRVSLRVTNSQSDTIGASWNMVVTDGVYAAFHGFADTTNPAGGVTSIAQDVTINNPGLTFDWHAGWWYSASTMDHHFDVVIRPAGGGAELDRIRVLDVPPSNAPDNGEQSTVVDLSAFVGQSVRVSFEWESFEDSTGRIGQFQLDNVQLKPLTVSSQYATSASASSEFRPATEAIGSPDDDADGNAGYWGPSDNTLGFEATLTLGYDTPVHANGTTIIEQWDPGFVFQIDAIDTSGALHTVWAGVDPTPIDPGNSARVNFFQSFPTTLFLVDGLVIYTRDISAGVWPGIDAVALHGVLPPSPLTHPDSCTPDTNGDGVVDLGDIVTFVELFTNRGLEADFNGDGIVDLGDINMFVEAFLVGCP